MSKFEIIPVSEVRVSPRGRKTVFDADLLKALVALKDGQALVLTPFGNVPKAQRATVAQTIRKHWRHVREDECRIDWNGETGMAQVSLRSRKG
jgi:hypothetical protein